MLVFEAQKVRVEAQNANSEIASVHFHPLEFIYWDETDHKITTASTHGATPNLLAGRSLEDKDFSAGVPQGATLLMTKTAQAY